MSRDINAQNGTSEVPHIIQQNPDTQSLTEFPRIINSGINTAPRITPAVQVPIQSIQDEIKIQVENRFKKFEDDFFSKASLMFLAMFELMHSKDDYNIKKQNFIEKLTEQFGNPMQTLPQEKMHNTQHTVEIHEQPRQQHLIPQTQTLNRTHQIQQLQKQQQLQQAVLNEILSEQIQSPLNTDSANQVNETTQINNTNLNVEAQSYIPKQIHNLPQHLTHSQTQRVKLTPQRTATNIQDNQIPTNYRTVQEGIQNKQIMTVHKKTRFSFIYIMSPLSCI